jgi:hypothetical protein
MKGRYSPAECIGARKERIEGNPDPKHISTSIAERQNLTIRMQMRRFTGLTNAFSKKFENHMPMVALYTVWYNFVNMHKTLRMTPAMAAGVSNKLWSVADLAEMVDAAMPKPGSVDRTGRKASTGSLQMNANETADKTRVPDNADSAHDTARMEIEYLRKEIITLTRGQSALERDVIVGIGAIYTALATVQYVNPK